MSDSGLILGKIVFDTVKNDYLFQPDNESIVLSEQEQAAIDKKLASFKSGESAVDMQDDD